MRSAIRTVLLLLPLTIAACADAPASSSPSDDEREILNDTEVTQDELGSRPSYTVRSVAPVGIYTSNEYCPGGFDVCDRIEVKKVDGKIQVFLGWDGHTKAEAWSSRGVLLF